MPEATLEAWPGTRDTPAEGPNLEIRRRTDKVGISPDRDTIVPMLGRC